MKYCWRLFVDRTFRIHRPTRVGSGMAVAVLVFTVLVLMAGLVGSSRAVAAQVLKMPFDSTQTWKVTQSVHPETAFDLDIVVANDSPEVLAVGSGTAALTCSDGVNQAIVSLTVDGATFKYLHLDSSSVTAAGITTGGVLVEQGQVLGQLLASPPTSNTGCGYTNGNAHVHLEFPALPTTLDGVVFSTSAPTSGTNLTSTNERCIAGSCGSPPTTTLPPPPTCDIGGIGVETVASQVECDALIALYLATTEAYDWYYDSGWNTPTDPCGWYGVYCSAGGVNKLILVLNTLNGTLPAEIGDLTNLTVLNLKHNKFLDGPIPPEIGNLTNLKVLDLSGGYLATGMTWLIGASLPPEIGNLTNLEVLDLEGNYFSSLPPEIGNLTNLTELDVGYNWLRTLPPEIGNLTNLTALDVGYNRIAALPVEVGNLDGLRSLYLAYNKMEGKDLTVEMLGLQDTLTYLTLADGAGGNNCLSVTDPALGPWLTSLNANWDECHPPCDGVVLTIVGTEGDDTIVGTSGRDVIHGLGGNDTIIGLDGYDTICGGPGDDVLIGGTGNDSLFGGNGKDTLTGGDGDDYLNGGAGTDTVDLSDATQAVTVDLEAHTASGIGDDWIKNSEWIIGSEYRDTLIGDSGRNKMWGGAGSDVMVGRAGRDTLYGEKGADRLRGNGGADVLRGNRGPDTLIGGTGADDLNGGPGTDSCDGETLTNCEL